MRPPSISDDDLVDALSDVFSRYGYEGASLNRLSEESGLKRASLYHRFPDGKAQIIQAVVARAAEKFEQMLAPAFIDADPATRATDVGRRIRDYYDGGAKSCLIVALSVADDEMRAAAVECVEAWREAFARIATDAGFTKAQAAKASMDAVAAIEGSLVISSTTGDTGPFKRVITSLPDRLTIAN